MKKTIENLTKAFIGESMARNRYTFYAKIAKKEGYEQVSEIFIQTAEQEKTHAKRLFEHIQELKEELKDEAYQEITVEAGAPTNYSDTVSNLKASIEGETWEHDEMYPEFAKIAEEEGLDKIAIRLRAIARAEDHHRERYEKLLNEVKAGTVFKKNQEKTWVCRECGYTHIGEEAPRECPSCDHPQAYYQLKCEEF